MYGIYTQILQVFTESKKTPFGISIGLNFIDYIPLCQEEKKKYTLE